MSGESGSPKLSKIGIKIGRVRELAGHFQKAVEGNRKLPSRSGANVQKPTPTDPEETEAASPPMSADDFELMLRQARRRAALKGEPSSTDTIPEKLTRYKSLDIATIGSTTFDDGYEDALAKEQSSAVEGSSRRKSVYEWAMDSNGIPGISAMARHGAQPKPGNINRDVEATPIRIHVATWNVEYGEFDKSSMLATKHPKKDKKQPPTNNDVPRVPDDVLSYGNFFGSQERTPKSSKRQNRSKSKSKAKTTLSPPDLSKDDQTTSSCVVFSESDSEIVEDPPEILIKQISRSELLLEDLKKELHVAHPEAREPFYDWLPPGYDVYVVALQETISSKIYHAIEVYLSRVHHVPYHRIKFTDSKIKGLGDGAYMSMKSTSIACFVSATALFPAGPVSLGTSKGMSLSFLNGSKGAVCIILKIFDQTICFISCHLPAGRPQSRCAARDLIRHKLSEAYCGYPDVNPTDVFHHIVWTGDFNARIQELRASAVLTHLEANEVSAVMVYDEWSYAEYNQDLKNDLFEELPVLFLPTYKKNQAREVVDRSSGQWASTEYTTQFKVQWYKGRKIKERVPSFTDRVIKRSLPALRSCLSFVPDSYKAADPTVPSILLSSDHAAVGCGLLIYPLHKRYDIPPLMFFESEEKMGQVPILHSDSSPPAFNNSDR